VVIVLFYLDSLGQLLDMLLNKAHNLLHDLWRSFGLVRAFKEEEVFVGSFEGLVELGGVRGSDEVVLLARQEDNQRGGVYPLQILLDL
jgi:hypothetical protein